MGAWLRCTVVASALLPACLSYGGRDHGLPAATRTGARPLDLNSASSLSRHIARERSSGKTVPGILEVTAHRLALRAYPYDRVDPRAHADAMGQRDRMPSTPRRFRDPTVGLGLLGLGPAWQSLGPRNLDPYYQIYMGPYRLSGRVNAAAFEPFATDSIWVCTSRGGVWKTDDLGLTWNNKSVGWATQQTSSIAVCPTNGYIVYVGTGSFEDGATYPDGIYKTVNGGAAWTRIGIPAMLDLAVSAITVDPDSVNVVMASAGRGPRWNGGVWRSEDAGLTWTQVLNTPAPWSDLKYGVSAGSWRYYYAVCLGNSPEIWRSNERGLSWTKVPLPFAPQFEDSLRIAPSAVNPERVYLLSVRQKRIWRSDDAGSHWSDITRNFGDQCAQASFNSYLMCTSRSSPSGPRDVLYAGALSTWVCLDPAVPFPSWQDLGQSYSNSALMHADQHCMAVAPYNPNRLLIGNDGGAYLVHFDPATNGWTVADPTNAGLTTILANRIAVAQTDPFRLLCGNQDNANSVCRGNLTVWETRFSGDGSGVAIHPTNADIPHCTAQGIGILQTRNNWSSQTNISPDAGSDRKGPFTHLALDPSDPDLLYTGTNYMWRWNDRERSWDARLGSTELATVNGIITAIAVAPSSSSHLYVGTLRGELWASTDSGAHWTYIASGTPALPSRSITGIAVDPTDPEQVYVTIGGTGAGHVFRCADVLASPRVWTDLSGSGLAALPSAHTNCVALDPDFPTDVLYVATDIGVFTTLDGGAP
ncbi:MAG: hypothetical protein FJX72_13345, partial [Armatimonadetes bacterium]|nr:hypothetical protein [Armatimonadota bacterium]